MDFETILNEVRDAVGKAPRRPVARNRIKFPSWVFTRLDRLGQIFWQQDRLLKDGQIVWGVLVQANKQMFAPGAFNCPGNMIYSLEAAMDARPQILMQAAEELFSIKGRETDRELQVFSKTLADEMERLMKLPVPLSLTGGLQTYFTGVMFERKHLPGGIIRSGLMPMLVHPRITSTMIVPHWYWPETLTAGQ